MVKLTEGYRDRPIRFLGFWDLQLICFEKEAWIEEVLKKPDHPDLQGYLAKQFNC